MTHDAEPAMTHDAEPAMTHDAEPAMTHDAEPAMTHDAEPAMTHDAEPAMTHDAEPAMTHDAEPAMTRPTQRRAGQRGRADLVADPRRATGTGDQRTTPYLPRGISGPVSAAEPTGNSGLDSDRHAYARACRLSRPVWLSLTEGARRNRFRSACIRSKYRA